MTYVEPTCDIPSYPYFGEIVLSEEFSPHAWACNDDQKNVNIDLSSFASVKGKEVIFHYVDGSTVQFTPHSSGVTITYPDGSKVDVDNKGIDLLDEATGEGFRCWWNLEEFGLKKKVLCLDALLFPGYEEFSTLEVVDDITLRYVVRYKN